MRHRTKWLVAGLGVLVSTPMGEELKAQQTAPTKTQTAPAQTSPKPRPGEILLSGTVVSIDVGRAELVLQATSFTLPNGRSAALAQPKKKVVLIRDTTTISPQGKNDKLTLGDLKVGDAVTASGRDLGAGNDLTAREIVLVTVRSAAQSSATGKDNTLEVTAMNPATPATLKIGEKFAITIRYNNASPNPVSIGAFLSTTGEWLGGFKANAPSPYATGSGDIEGWFKIDRPVAVDKIQVNMVDSKTGETLLTKELPVQLNWAGPVVTKE